MEKRLFLAVGLSLLVVFVFQSFFGNQSKHEIENVQQNLSVTKIEEVKDVSVKEGDSVFLASQSIEEKFSSFSKNGIELSFSNIGGNLNKVNLLKHSFVFPVKNILSFGTFDDVPFELVSDSSDEVLYSFKSNKWGVLKKYYFSKENVLSCDFEVTNLTNSSALFSDNVGAFTMDISRMDDVAGADRTLLEYVVFKKGKVYRKSNITGFNEKWNKNENNVEVESFGFRDRYFALVFQPKFLVNNFFVKQKIQKTISIGFDVDRINVLPNEKIVFSASIYLGPQKLDLLKTAGEGFSKIMVFSDWAWLDALSKGIYWSLGAMHNLIPVWGLCIILISLIIYALMYPLTLKSLVSMKKMQLVQPKIKQIQDKYKNNPEKVNQEVVLIYKQYGVNPLSGCLPMLLQMPIFVGLYQVLWRSFYFRGQGFLWIKDLSQPDHLFKLPFDVPFLGGYFNILPILMVFIMAFQQKMSTQGTAVSAEQAAQQKMMATFFPVFIGFIFYNFASGLNIYFVVFYLLSAATQWRISRMDISNSTK